MAKNTLTINIKINDEDMLAFSDLICGIVELAELVPNWNGFEKDKITKELSETIDKLVFTGNKL